MSNKQKIKFTPDHEAARLSEAINTNLKSLCVQAVMELNELLTMLDDPKFVITRPEKYSQIQRHFIAHVVRSLIKPKEESVIIKPGATH